MDISNQFGYKLQTEDELAFVFLLFQHVSRHELVLEPKIRSWGWFEEVNLEVLDYRSCMKRWRCYHWRRVCGRGHWAGKERFHRIEAGQRAIRALVAALSCLVAALVLATRPNNRYPNQHPEEDEIGRRKMVTMSRKKMVVESLWIWHEGEDPWCKEILHGKGWASKVRHQ